ncbi:MAG: Dyp-type peroxidase [Candidatus Nanopelagicales bacterium]|nr:Dyp-type peroxidase [Candidatus Nanopelagicales bacterium]
MDEQTQNQRGITRRGVLSLGGVAAAGIAGGFALGQKVSVAQATDTTAKTTRESGVIDFYGPHQAGIATAPTVLISYIGVNVQEPARKNAERIFRLLSDDAARLTQGKPALADTEPSLAVSPHNLTIGIGIGLPLVSKAKLTNSVPKSLVEIPAFATDALEPGWDQTDLIIQIGTDDPLVMAHTIRMLSKDISSLSDIAWVQQGFRAAPSPGDSQRQDRNLMGQVEGTDNPSIENFNDVVWIEETGGTVLVLRRIRMLLDTWDALDTNAKELAMGRKLDTGAPLGMKHEFDPVPLDAVDDLGLPVIPEDAHVRLAHTSQLDEMIFRRGYSYDNGIVRGTNDMGLLFAAYTKNPSQSFIPIQTRLAQSDAFNRWISTIGSATYYFPGGCAEGGYIGQELFT